MIRISLPQPDFFIIGRASPEEEQLHGLALAQHFGKDVVFRAEGWHITFTQAMHQMAEAHAPLALAAVQGMDSMMGALL